MQTLRFLHEFLGAHPERRGASRFFADFDVILQAAGDKQRGGAATILDLTAMGFRLLHSLELNPGEHVIVTTPSRSLVGRVVWTLEFEGCFIAGIVISQGNPPDSSDSWDPASPHGTGK